MCKLLELAYLRNQLLGRKFNKDDQVLLKNIKGKILDLKTPFTKLAVYSIDNCENDINMADFKSASKELNLIHNFTFLDLKKWDINYFFKIEVLSYLEETEDVERIKKIIKLSAELIDLQLS